jgi:hypothetical protein
MTKYERKRITASVDQPLPSRKAVEQAAERLLDRKIKAGGWERTGELTRRTRPSGWGYVGDASAICRKPIVSR